MYEINKVNDQNYMLSIYFDIEISRLRRWIELLKKERVNSKRLVLEEMQKVLDEWEKL